MKVLAFNLLFLGLPLFTLAQHDMHNQSPAISSQEMLSGLNGEDLEVAFLSMMIEHHKGAIEMADWILEISTHPELTRSAKAIIEAQGSEIEQMTEWLNNWYNQELDNPGVMMMKDQTKMMMQILGKAENPEKAFLYQMSLHHNEAIDMAQSVLLSAERVELRELAKHIIITQTQEIAQYQEWLRDGFGSESSR